MPKERYYINEELKKNKSVLISGKELHHMVHVMRAKPGSAIEIVNGQGKLAQATLEKAFKKEAVCKITSIIEKSAPTSSIILIQAIPRLNRIDTIVEKCTELGMEELWLFPGEKSERIKLSNERITHLEQVAISAMKQCGRLYLPKIILKPPIKNWTCVPQPAFFGDLNENAPHLLKLLNQKINDKCYFFIGPESGFSDSEYIALNEMRVQGVNIGENILRTDTAAITACALMHNLINSLS